jgi:hypothetical protein
MRTNIAGWREIGGRRFYFRSKAEVRFAAYLEWLRINGNVISWQYEPRVFEFPIRHGTTRYTPDFLCTVGKPGVTWDTWYEVKGYMDSRSATKIKRFKKYFPNENLIVIDKKWFIRNSPKLKGLVPNWE